LISHIQSDEEKGEIYFFVNCDLSRCLFDQNIELPLYIYRANWAFEHSSLQIRLFCTSVYTHNLIADMVIFKDKIAIEYVKNNVVPHQQILSEVVPLVRNAYNQCFLG
jgi:hypothetical protein